MNDFVWLTYVMTCMIVCFQFKTKFAWARVRAKQINTNIRTIAIVVNAFVNVQASIFIGSKLIARPTLAHMSPI